MFSCFFVLFDGVIFAIMHTFKSALPVRSPTYASVISITWICCEYVVFFSRQDMSASPIVSASPPITRVQSATYPAPLVASPSQASGRVASPPPRGPPSHPHIVTPSHFVACKIILSTYILRWFFQLLNFEYFFRSADQWPTCWCFIFAFSHSLSGCVWNAPGHVDCSPRDWRPGFLTHGTADQIPGPNLSFRSSHVPPTHSFTACSPRMDAHPGRAPHSVVTKSQCERHFLYMNLASYVQKATDNYFGNNPWRYVHDDVADRKKL